MWFWLHVRLETAVNKTHYAAMVRVGEGEINMHCHAPLPESALYKTGEKVPISGNWEDQHEWVDRFESETTFPPSTDCDGPCVYRYWVQ